MKKALILFTVLLFNVACKEKETLNEKKTIVTTTQMVGDVAKNIVGEECVVVSLMGPGVDPHLYKATQGDIEQLQQADLILYNGLHLEGKTQDVFEKMKRSKPVVALAKSIEEKHLINLSDSEKDKAYDPHIWHSVSLWAKVVQPALEAIISVDSSKRQLYERNAKAFLKQLEELDKGLKQDFKQLEGPQKLLITSHDAFNYFGETYGFEVKGLQGISTVSEVGIKDVTDMVDLIVQRQVKAVFVESSVPRKPLQAVIEGCKEKGHQLSIGGTLYSDAMGNYGTPEGTYVGMIKANAQTIINALK